LAQAILRKDWLKLFENLSASRAFFFCASVRKPKWVEP